MISKKTTSLFAVLMVALLTATFAVATVNACELTPGFTPGFWKHNIQVRLSHAPYNLGLTKGAYNAFSGGPLDGDKLNDAFMDSYLTRVRTLSDNSGLTFADALAALNLRGWSADRTNMANWFNEAAGYGDFVD